MGSFLKVASGMVYRLFQLFKLFKLYTWALDTYCNSIQYIHFRNINVLVSSKKRAHSSMWLEKARGRWRKWIECVSEDGMKQDFPCF